MKNQKNKAEGAAPDTVSAEQAAQTQEAALPEADPVEELTLKLAEQEDRYKRMLAEYDNYRKRSARERESLYTDAYAAAVASLLPVIDNLERAEQQSCTDAEYQKGVGLIVKQMLEILKKAKITPFAAPGDTFDPQKHNAVLHVEDESLGESEICEVLLRGYAMGDKIIRHAMVKVAN